MDLGTIIDWVFKGTTVMGVISFFIFYKSKKKTARLDASKADVEVSKSALQGMDTITKQLNTAYEKIGKMGRRIDELKESQNVRAQHVAILNHKIISFAEILEQQMDLKEFAEYHIDLNLLNPNRVPPLGEYKSLSQRETVKQILKDLKRYEVEYIIGAPQVINNKKEDNEDDEDK